ncbi:hypothetical protein R6Q59_035648 [Mikania micrantha]
MSSSSKLYNYDVFLSFRGEDSRKTFVDFLYSTLVDKQINTYKDDKTLDRGEHISPALLKAIEESWIAVIIFTENYADSSWCLEELAHIMKCNTERGLLVMPIFYGVDPSQARKQKRKFQKAFVKHEKHNKEKAKSWRKALVEACNIAGYDTKTIANGHEKGAIDIIVDTISKIISNRRVNDYIDDEDLVGMNVRMEGLEKQLHIGSDDVLMVGICGIGGSGKTTLASSICMKIRDKFQGYCFVDNVREYSKTQRLKHLQEKMLSRLLKLDINLQDSKEGKVMIKSRLQHRSVLIILDDVDHIDQLDALAGSHRWFGSGTRVIITTRDEQLLRSHKVDKVCDVELLSREEATELLNKRAYNEKKHVKDYEILSSSVVSYAAGLPLALKVLGSSLYDNDENEWRSALDRLNENPEMEIIEKLKISYDGLKTLEKQLFLDIACFFRWKGKNEAMDIFEACGYHPIIGIKTLE